MVGESLSGDENSKAVPLNAVPLLVFVTLSGEMGIFFGTAVLSLPIMRLRSRPGVLPLADFTFAALVGGGGGVLNLFGFSIRFALSSSGCTPSVFG